MSETPKLPSPEFTEETLDQKAVDRRVQQIEEKQEIILTDKQAKFVQLVHDNPEWSDTKIARAAGYSVSSKSRSSHIVKTIKGTLGPIFDTYFGTNTFTICKVISEALEATDKKHIVLRKYVDGKVDSEGIEIVEQPNWQARLAAIGKLIRLGSLDPGVKLTIDVRDEGARLKFVEKMEDINKLEREERALSKEVQDAEYELLN